MKIAKVIVDVPSTTINQTFDYLIPKRFHSMLKPGMRVIVPFGPRKITGFVVDRVSQSEYDRLKAIIDVLDLTPVLTPELIQLGKWLAEETLSLYITSFQAMLPQVLKAQYKKELVRMTRDPLPAGLESLFAGRDVIPYEEAVQSAISYHQLQKAIQKGYLSIHYLVKSRITKQYVTMIAPGCPVHMLEEAYYDLPKHATKQREILASFIQNPEPQEQQALLTRLNTTRAPVKRLEEKGLLSCEKVEKFRNPYDDQSIEKTYPLTLTVEQQQAITPIKQTIAAEKHDVFLLHGVTGSGKTEIYLQAIQDVMQRGKEAIVLVPEISLTQQMVKRFKGRFGSKVEVMHSGLSPGEKYDEWRRVQQRDVQVVVGARSAIFAPFTNIGIIIIDEEHEASYKQEEQPRYHARDVAIQRGKHHSCPVLLGTATPTLESYARAQKGVYKLLTLTQRTNEQAMPNVEVVDMRKELRAGNRTMFSRLLKKKIKQRLSRGEQIVLLLNRRGYSTFVMCRECGYVNECSHCDIALTYHKNSRRLKCHYCDYEEPVPLYCPECESDLIRYFGTGTQRVEEALT